MRRVGIYTQSAPGDSFKSCRIFTPEEDYLALDFDGVIADSIEECLVVGHNALVEFSGAGKRIHRLNELDGDSIRICRKLRNFIRYSEDYVYIHYALRTNTKIADQRDFDDFLLRHGTLRGKFRTIFQEVRRNFSSEQPGHWIRLNPLYPGIRDFLSAYPHKDRLFIITTKRTHFVDTILTANGIRLLKKNVFNATGKKSKAAIISDLLHTRAAEATDFFFIDDQIDTLLDVAGSGIRLFLAGWGYTNEVQRQRARSARIPILTLKDFLREFQAAAE